jgi:hypothetical protein
MTTGLSMVCCLSSALSEFCAIRGCWEPAGVYRGLAIERIA